MSPEADPIDRRIRVLCVRRRLEELAASLVEQVTGLRPAQHHNVAERLLLLATGASSRDVRAAHALARRAGGTYAETSTVLHSTRAFGDLPEVMVQEWESVVDDVDRLFAGRAIR